MDQIRGRPMAGRIVLVTGATAGIGRATAAGLATMGAHLAITGRDRGRAEGAAREIRVAGGGQVDVFVADLSSQSQVRRLADEVLQGLPRIDEQVPPEPRVLRATGGTVRRRRESRLGASWSSQLTRPVSPRH